MQAFRGSGNLTHAITKAKKFGIIDHDGDEDEAYVRKRDLHDVIVWPILNSEILRIYLFIFQSLNQSKLIFTNLPIAQKFVKF